MPDTEWFYVESGSRCGPVTTEALTELLQTRLAPETLVWHKGLSGWIRADQLPEFAAHISPPPPAQSRPAPPPLPSSEGPTLNPLRLFRRCFSWKGRFTRAEYAVANFGNILLVSGAALGLRVVGSIAGADVKTLEAMGGLLFLLWLPFSIAVALGSGVCRLHDLGKPGWWITMTFVPCANWIMILPALRTGCA